MPRGVLGRPRRQRAQAFEHVRGRRLALEGSALLELEQGALGDDVAVHGIRGPGGPPVHHPDAEPLLGGHVPERLGPAQDRRGGLRAAQPQEIGRGTQRAREGIVAGDGHGHAHAGQPPGAGGVDPVRLRPAAGGDRRPHDGGHLLGLRAEHGVGAARSGAPADAASRRARSSVRPCGGRGRRRPGRAPAAPSAPPRSRERPRRRRWRGRRRRRPRPRAGGRRRRGAAPCAGATGSPPEADRPSRPR